MRNVKCKNLVTSDSWSKVDVQFGPDIQGNLNQSLKMLIHGEV